MTSRNDFERRFGQRLRGFAALAETRPEPDVVARAVAARSRLGLSHRGGAFQPRVGTVNARSRALLLVAVLALGSIATAIVAGRFHEAPVVAPVASPSPVTAPSPAAIATVIPSLVPLHLSPLPPGRLGDLAYGLDGSIYVANADGTKSVRIARGVYDQGGAGPGGCGSFWGEGPIWSPDGRHLAYRGAWDASCSRAPAAGNVFLSDPDGKVVTSFQGQGWQLSWSPDSTRVVTSVDLGHTFGIYGLDGVRQALFTVAPGYEVHGDYDPEWSPDGLSVLMMISKGGAPSLVWDFPIDGGTPRLVPPDDPRSHWRDWAYSPDGTRVAYTASGSLVVARADGSQAQVLVARGVAGEAPVWSPTSDRVAFTWSPNDLSYDQANNANPRPWELRVADIGSGVTTTLVSPRGTDYLRVISYAPEGDRILFSRSDSNGTRMGLWSVQVAGPAPRLLVAGTAWGDWQWQPAGP